MNRPKRAQLNQKLVQQMLRECGYKPRQVQATGDGVGAVVYLSSADPDLLVGLGPVLNGHGWVVRDNFVHALIEAAGKHQIAVQSCGHLQRDEQQDKSIYQSCHNVVQFWN